MPEKTKILMRAANLPRRICCHLVGEEHSLGHQMAVGCVIMVTGVLCAKVGGQIHAFHFHYFADLVGYLVHGVGAVPFIEWLIGREAEEVELLFPEIADEALKSVEEQIEQLFEFTDDELAAQALQAKEQ